MKLIVTGGGTGGHVFPALETALQARSQGHEVIYFGSIRGQEREACQAQNVDFAGFPSQPLYRLTSLNGLKALFSMLRAIAQVTPAMRKAAPQALFATGGYSSAPVLFVARKQGIPTVLHEQNSVPGRTLLMASKWAHSVCCVFHRSLQEFPGAKVVRTGLPVRQSFMKGSWRGGGPLLVVGGSQGSQSLNEAILSLAVKSNGEILHVTGKTHFDSVKARSSQLGHAHYVVRDYLSASDMAEAMQTCSMILCRSGAGTLAELAALGVPSLLVPYPHAFGDHQKANAVEVTDLGAARWIDQSRLSPETIYESQQYWQNTEHLSQMDSAWQEWQVPQSMEAIWNQIEDAVQAKAESRLR